MKRLKIILQSKYLGLILFIIVAVLSFLRIKIFTGSKYNGNEKSFSLKIIDIRQNKDNYKIVFQEKEKLVCYYSSFFPYNVGDIVEVSGTLERIRKNTIPNLFNYRNYEQNKGIYYEIEINKIKLKKKNNN